MTLISRSARGRMLATAASAALAAGAVVLVTRSAGAHPSLDVVSVPAESNERLALSIPPEGATSSTRNATVRLHVPEPFIVLGCFSPVGWTCVVEPTVDGDPDVGGPPPVDGPGATIEWSGGASLQRTDRFNFVVRTPDELGTFTFSVDQVLSDGTQVQWTGGADSPHPAPRLKVTDADSDPVPNDTPPTSHAPTTTPFPTFAPSTTAAGTATPGTTGPSGPSGPAASAPPSSGAPTAPTEPDPGLALPPDQPAIVPPDGGMTLGLDDSTDPMHLTPARILLGLGAATGGVLAWRLRRRAEPLG